MGRRQFPVGRKVDYLSFDEFTELLREIGYPSAPWWHRVRAEVSMRSTFQQWFKRLGLHRDEIEPASPVLEMHCSPLDNQGEWLSIPIAQDGQPLIRYPYKRLNLMSEGLTLEHLAKRGSLIYGSSFSICLRDETINPQPLMRAAKFIHSIVRLWREVATGKYLDGIGGDGLESAGFHDLFSTNRIPASSVCDILERRPYSSHIVIAVEGLFFPLQVIDDGEVVPTAEIFIQLRHLELELRGMVTGEKEAPVGVLTTLEREKWHCIREQLSEHPQSRYSLEVMESALFVTCLDLDFQDENRDAVWRYFKDREIENRWFDKSMQLIVTRSGSAALTFESAAVDAHVAAQFVNKLWDVYESDQTSETTSLVFAGDSDEKRFELLEWSCSDQSIWDLTSDASTQHSERRRRWQHCSLKTRTIGRDFFEQEDLNADAVLHIALQMAASYLFPEQNDPVARVTHTRHIEGGRYSMMPVLTPELRQFIDGARSGDVDRNALVSAVESIEGRLIRLQSGWDLTGMFMALSCFAAEGDLVDRVEAMDAFKGGLSANPLVRSLWDPSYVTHGSADRRSLDFIIPVSASGSHAITISYVIRRGYCRLDIWGQDQGNDHLQKFCGLVENSLRLVLKVMGAG